MPNKYPRACITRTYTHVSNVQKLSMRLVERKGPITYEQNGKKVNKFLNTCCNPCVDHLEDGSEGYTSLGRKLQEKKKNMKNSKK